MAIPVPGRVVEALRRSTVQIVLANRHEHCAGSGIIVQPDVVITNAHVLQGTNVTVEHWDGGRHSAHIGSVDARRDLALLHVPNLNGAPVALGDSQCARPGTPVAAIGHPLGFVGALSSRVIHSMHRAAAHPHGLAHEWVCADIHLAPGNSGGPLVDFSGQLLGVNTMVLSGGLALAVPSRAVDAFLRRSRNGRRLGVTLRPVRLPTGVNGLLLLQFESGAAATAASLQPGDILTAAGDLRLEHPEALQQAIDNAANGLLTLEFLRGDLRATRRVTVLLTEASRQAA